ncbi:MAG: sugar transferase [Bacteroidales bacterium]|nr:sugar transferase [Bacteroidales bacterium]
MNTTRRKINLALKRIGDVLISLLIIIVLFVIPVFEIIAIAIGLTSKGPVIFKQKRVGKDKKIFLMFKFRTMIVEQFDKDGNEIMSEDRITSVGRILRKLSLDELPQLFNILNGTMSIIGPRPMLDYQAERCTEEENGRFAMRPGMTGWAQVKGRNNIYWEERIKYDLEYIRNYSIWFDIKIFFLSFITVFKREGTDVKTEYRGVDRFSKAYQGENKQ